MARDFDLDLEVLTPKPKLVKVEGDKFIEVYPPKFKSLVALIELYEVVENAGDNVDLNLIVKIKEALLPVIPELKNPDFDLSLEQMMVLLEFVMTLATPQDDKELIKKGYTPKQITENTEKKTELGLPA